jgi:hypothetical protein
MNLMRRRLGRSWGTAVLCFIAALSGCRTDPQSGAAATAQPLAIAGTPPAAVTAGQTYQFQPTVINTISSHYGFAVTNKPRWATLNTTSGALTGTPAATDVGVYNGIVVMVTSKSASAALPPFTIRVNPASSAGGSLPSISGTPATTVSAGTAYDFIPVAVSPSGARLAFSIQNLPQWASFNAATGEISGTPDAASTGTYANILMTVTDGRSSASLPAFTITVAAPGTGTATLSWMQPTTNADGTALTDLAGYRIYYGNDARSLTQSVVISNTALTTYIVKNLGAGTWYFAVKSYNSANVESSLSPVVSSTI